MNSASMLVNEDCVEENRNSYVSMVMNAAYDRSNPQAEEVEKDLNPSTPFMNSSLTRPKQFFLDNIQL